MKVGLLADVHANLHALQAVLADASRRGCEAIWNLGDMIGYGPHPDEVVDLLRTTENVGIIGNYDQKALRFQGPADEWHAPRSPAKAFAFRWAFDQLSLANRRYLSSLGETRRIDVLGWRILLTHAGPRDNEEIITTDTPDDQMAVLADLAGADLVLLGHSHRVLDRQAGSVRFINPGSAGRDEQGDFGAAYATLTICEQGTEVEFHRVAYDRQAEAEAAEARGLPEAFALMILHSCGLDDAVARIQADQRHVVPDCHRDDLLKASVALADACHYEPPHAQQVTRLALMLLDDLVPLHCLGPDARVLLNCAGILHDVGWLRGQKGHHKASLAIISTADSLPADQRTRDVIGSVARYHRRALPADKHGHYARLQDGDRYTVRVLASLLRVADGLDRTHCQVVRGVSCKTSRARILIQAHVSGPAKTEKAAAEKKADLMAEVFGRRIEIGITDQDE